MKNLRTLLPICALASLSAPSFAQQPTVVHYHASIDTVKYLFGPASPQASAGNTVYFPVNIRGALLYMGDGHAAMGDAEIAGTSIEVPMRARLPRIAFTELVKWIHRDYGLSELDAYELLSQVATGHLNEMVDPNFVVVAE